MDRVEPQSANDYDDRTTAAVKSVLVEIGQILGSFEGKFAVIGGAVPWLLLSEAEMPHVGTADVDLALHAEAWATASTRGSSVRATGRRPTCAVSSSPAQSRRPTAGRPSTSSSTS